MCNRKTSERCAGGNILEIRSRSEPKHTTARLLLSSFTWSTPSTAHPTPSEPRGLDILYRRAQCLVA